MKNYSEMLEHLRSKPRVTISVAVAEDPEVLRAINAVKKLGIAEAILIGDALNIQILIDQMNFLAQDFKIIDAKDDNQATLTAVSAIKRGEAQVLMKGKLNSSDFVKAVISPEGLRNGRLLSHFAVYEIPGWERLLSVTDGGINVLPNLEQKKEILLNAVEALQSMGIEKPNTAVITANETVNPKIPATIDAQALADMSLSGEINAGIVEGPIALDVALDQAAAHHKGIQSKIAGMCDIFLVPNIEVGNALGKAIMYFGKAKMAGVVLGASNPIVMASRADTAEGKVNSILLACLLGSNLNKTACTN